jgi:hypothetical protein
VLAAPPQYAAAMHCMLSAHLQKTTYRIRSEAEQLIRPVRSATNQSYYDVKLWLKTICADATTSQEEVAVRHLRTGSTDTLDAPRRVT